MTNTDATRATELLTLVQQTPAEGIAALQAGTELRKLRDTLSESDLTDWTPDADDGFDEACTKLAQVRGRHYLAWLPQLDGWRIEGTEAADTAGLELLDEILDAVERKGRLQGWALPRNYYERAAIVYARRGQYEAEAAVCERYENATPAGTGGALQSRLSAAREQASHPGR